MDGGATGREVYTVDLEGDEGGNIYASFTRVGDAPFAHARWLQFCAHLPSLSKVVVAGGQDFLQQRDQGTTDVWVGWTVFLGCIALAWMGCKLRHASLTY